MSSHPLISLGMPIMTILHPGPTKPLDSYGTPSNLCHQFMPRSYITLIRTQLLYCSQVWRPHFITYIAKLEKIQKRATKYIHNNYTSDYKSRLMILKILPLMVEYELNNSLLFYVRNLKSPASHFDFRDFISFSKNATRSATYKNVP